MFYFFGKGKCTEVFQGIRDITPEVYCLIGKHLFSSVSTRMRFTEVLLRCIPCIVCMPITSILEEVIKQGRSGTQYVTMVTKLLGSSCGTLLVESYCKKSNSSDSN